MFSLFSLVKKILVVFYYKGLNKFFLVCRCQNLLSLFCLLNVFSKISKAVFKSKFSSNIKFLFKGDFNCCFILLEKSLNKSLFNNSLMSGFLKFSLIFIIEVYLVFSTLKIFFFFQNCTNKKVLNLEHDNLE